MGCDIHVYTEVKRNIRDKEIWVNADNWRVDPYENGKYKNENGKYKPIHIYSRRNYSLFSILAGVRDYSGKTKAIAFPKGLPNDISFETKKQANLFGVDGHTHSWFTLKELKEFQTKNPVVVHTGLITLKQSENLDKGILPESWCQDTNRLNVIKREWSELDNSLLDIINPLQERLKDIFWIYTDEYDPTFDESIRIVFWFDN